jgi:hypothetical protein
MIIRRLRLPGGETARLCILKDARQHYATCPVFVPGAVPVLQPIRGFVAYQYNAEGTDGDLVFIVGNNTLHAIESVLSPIYAKAAVDCDLTLTKSRTAIDAVFIAKTNRADVALPLYAEQQRAFNAIIDEIWQHFLPGILYSVFVNENTKLSQTSSYEDAKNTYDLYVQELPEARTIMTWSGSIHPLYRSR